MMQILYKYKIRRLFPDSKYGIKDMIERRTSDAKKNNFKILPVDKIYDVIISLIIIVIIIIVKINQFSIIFN